MDLHLVDGTYELFRQYYALPSAKGAGGAEVGAVRGLCRTLLSLARGGATHIACAFDHVIESFRNDLFDGYKTGAGIDPELLAQFQLAEEATEALGFTTWSMVEFEADDALATAASRYASDTRVDTIYLCSVDKDLMQCVRDRRVVVFDRRREIIYDEAGVLEKLGVSPPSVPDYLALVGDSADGIPGLPQWGAKSTARVLSRYEHIEAIPARGQDWDVKVRGATRLAETLAARRDEALLYRQLATLRGDVPLTESIDDLEWRGADRDRVAALAGVLADKGLERLISRFRD